MLVNLCWLACIYMAGNYRCIMLVSKSFTIHVRGGYTSLRHCSCSQTNEPRESPEIHMQKKKKKCIKSYYSSRDNCSRPIRLQAQYSDTDSYKMAIISKDFSSSPTSDMCKTVSKVLMLDTCTDSGNYPPPSKFMRSQDFGQYFHSNVVAEECDHNNCLTWQHYIILLHH